MKGQRKKTQAGMLTALAVIGWTFGCHKPAGELFPPIEPAMVWPPAPQTPRVQWVGSIESSADLKAEQSGWESFKSTLRGPRDPIRFASPLAVACRADRKIAVADANAAAVHLMDLNERSHLVTLGDEKQRFAVPVGVAWSKQRLLVADAELHEIIELNESGQVTKRFGSQQLKRPVGLVHVPNRDQVYVVDGGDHCIKVFSHDGSYVYSIGQRGTAPGEFNYPTHLAYDGKDVLAVSDTGNFRVQLIDLDGHPIQVIGKKGDAAGDLALPKGVAFDGDGHLYVADAQFENIQIFDRSGRLLLAIGQEGGDRGSFALPAGVCMTEQNRLWVADSANRRLQVLQYLPLPSESLAHLPEKERDP